MAVNMGMGEHPNSKAVEDVYSIVMEKKTPKVEHEAIKCPPTEASFKVLDLPLIPYGLERQKSASHMVDIIEDHEGDFDMNEVDRLMKAAKYDELPEPLSPASSENLGYTMHLAMGIPGEGGKRIIVKYFQFVGQGAHVPRLTQLNRMKRGAYLWNLSWSSDRKTAIKVLLFMLERMGGTFYRFVSWGADPASKVVDHYDLGKRRAGYKFLRERGPKTNVKNQFVEWTDEQIHDPDSPIYGWTSCEVKESLVNYAKASVGARTLDKWAVTLKKFHPYLFEQIVVPCLQTHRTHSTWWVGQSRTGDSYGCLLAGNMSLTHMCKSIFSILTPTNGGHILPVGSSETPQ